jgi:hypothetical protein
VLPINGESRITFGDQHFQHRRSRSSMKRTNNPTEALVRNELTQRSMGSLMAYLGTERVSSSEFGKLIRSVSCCSGGSLIGLPPPKASLSLWALKRWLRRCWWCKGVSVNRGSFFHWFFCLFCRPTHTHTHTHTSQENGGLDCRRLHGLVLLAIVLLFIHSLTHALTLVCVCEETCSPLRPLVVHPRSHRNLIPDR